MAMELTPLGKLFKWIVVPLIAATIGYVLIGPRIGGKIVKKMRTLPGIGSALGQENAPVDQPATSKRGKQFQNIRGIGQ
jgi:hypothetical protein